eukprot:SAG22_NODE_2073_length_3049_cov_22.966102_3_plen_141_part_00
MILMPSSRQVQVARCAHLLGVLQLWCSMHTAYSASTIIKLSEFTTAAARCAPAGREAATNGGGHRQPQHRPAAVSAMSEVPAEPSSGGGQIDNPTWTGESDAETGADPTAAAQVTAAGRPDAVTKTGGFIWILLNSYVFS